jgi:hypothetical protein
MPRPYGGPHEPNPGDKPKPYGKPYVPKLGAMPRPYGGPHGPKPGDKSKPYGEPHGLKPGDKPGPFVQKLVKNKGSYGRPREPKSSDISGTYTGSGPDERQSSTERSKSFDNPKSPSSFRNPLGLKQTYGHRLIGSSGSNLKTSSKNKLLESPKFNDRTFTGRGAKTNVRNVKFDDKVFSSKRLVIQSREEDRQSGGKNKPIKSYKILTKNNYISPNRKPDQRTQIKFKNNKGSSNGDDNYNYYEFKHVIKQGRLNKPITIHHRRGEDDNSSQNLQRYSNYNILNQKMNSYLSNKYVQNSNLKINNKSNTLQDNSKNIQKSSYRKVTNTITNKIGGRLNYNNPRKDLTPDDRNGREIKTFSQYQKYEQKNKINYNNSKYQLNQSNDIRNTLSKYQNNDNNDLIEINCPVHGRRAVRKSKLRELGIIVD